MNQKNNRDQTNILTSNNQLNKEKNKLKRSKNMKDLPNIKKNKKKKG